MDKYAVMGNPIAHSKSPQIHRLFAGQTGESLEYTAIRVEPGTFNEAVARFQSAGGRGLNITVPFKEEAWRLAATCSPRAKRAGAVNTLVLDGADGIYGDTTDGTGLVRDLTQNHDIGIADKRVLLVGAGGAARCVTESLLNESPALLVIANRTAEKAVELARIFCTLGRVEGCGLDDLAGQGFELVINATAAGLNNAVPALPASIINETTCCYDMMYGDAPTAFVRWSQEQGTLKALDGLGMLVEQAAESFFIWRNMRPDTGPVIAALRSTGWVD
jgi:shikimate dehydrogenase